MKELKDFFYLTFKILPEVIWFNYQEEKKVKKLFYQKGIFKKIDQIFTKLYFLKNTYSIYKKYMKVNGHSSLYTYGETPLTVFAQMFEKASLTSDDCFVDIGCGRGRGVFFASSVWGCKALGIERVPIFCENGNKIAKLLLEKTQFFCEDISSFNFKLGSFFYFYALCMEEQELTTAILQLEKVRSGSKVVTVSFPLTEYSNSFSVVSSWESKYPWGTAEIFLNIKKS